MHRPLRLHRLMLGLAVLFVSSTVAAAAVRADAPGAALLPAETRRQIDDAAREVLAQTRTPSASIAVVRDGRIAYLQAYGDATLGEPAVPARPATRYAIGSISKQFTAAALLLLQQDGKLSLDDPVAKYLPELSRAREITLRQLLSHTAGYQDYWPHDYTFTQMLEPVTPEGIFEGWARRPLDYEPGTRWQYSNTGYAIAGRIAELVSGEPLYEFLERRVFIPLHMDSASDFDREPLAPGNAKGYESYALGPPREVRPSAPGWLFGAAGLAMTAEDLAKWNVSMIERRVLQLDSYRQLETDTRLANGVATGYGLGLDVSMEGRRWKLEHSGEVSGFTAENVVYPDERTAIVVLTNQMAARGSSQLAAKIATILFASVDAVDAARTAQARQIFAGLQQGRIDRSLFSPNANAYFSELALGDFRASLAPLGEPSSFTHQRTWLRGGMTGRSYVAAFAGRKLRVWTYERPDGRLEQYQVQATD